MSHQAQQEQPEQPQVHDVDMDDDDLFDAIGTLGAAANAAADTSLDQPLRDMSGHVAETVGDQLSEAFKRANP